MQSTHNIHKPICPDRTQKIWGLKVKLYDFLRTRVSCHDDPRCNVKVTSFHWTFCVSLQTTIHCTYCAGS